MKPTIAVWYGDTQKCCAKGQPQRYFNLLGRVSPGEEIVTFGCTVNGGPLHDLCLGPDQRRLVQPGDFNAEIELQEFDEGENDVDLIAENIEGEMAARHIKVFYSGVTACKMPVNTNWGTASHIQELA